MFYFTIQMHNLSSQAGTGRFSNATMETYSQATSATISSSEGAGLNCFSCHNTGIQNSFSGNAYVLPAPNDLNLSHNFLGYTHSIIK